MSGNSKPPPKAVQALVMALVLEGVCIMVGVGAFLMTDRWIWIVIGVVAGTGFSIPALLKYVRATKEQSDASG